MGVLACPIADCARITPGRGFAGPPPAHSGVDFPVPTGTVVRAAGAAIVRDVYWNLGGGRMVALQHGDELETRYAHLSRALVRKGQLVAAGDPIAESGATGALIRGANLHFEALQGGRFVDPLPLLGGAHAPTSRPVKVRRMPPGYYPPHPGATDGSCPPGYTNRQLFDVGNLFADHCYLEGSTGTEDELASLGQVVTLALPPLAGSLPVIANAALIVGAVLVGWGGVRRILDG